MAQRINHPMLHLGKGGSIYTHTPLRERRIGPVSSRAGSDSGASGCAHLATLTSKVNPTQSYGPRLSHERLTVETGQALTKRLFRALLPPCIPVDKGYADGEPAGRPQYPGHDPDGKGG